LYYYQLWSIGKRTFKSSAQFVENERVILDVIGIGIGTERIEVIQFLIRLVFGTTGFFLSVLSSPAFLLSVSF